MARFSSSTTGYTLWLEVTETGTAVTNNTSTLSWTLGLTSNSGWSFYTHSFGWIIKFNNITMVNQARDPNNLQFDLNSNSSVVLGTGTVTVEHNADGTLTEMPVYAEIDCASLTYLPDGMNVSGTIDLTTLNVGHVYIDNGSSWDLYEAYIDNGSSWDLYKLFVDNGSDWDLYS